MGEIDRKEVATVALLALGILLFANPAYTQGQAGSAAQVQVQQEIQPDNVTPATVGGVNPDLSFRLFVVGYGSLNQQERTMFDTAREGIFVVRGEQDLEGIRDFLLRDLQQQVPQVPILYEGEVYERTVREERGAINFEYSTAEGGYIVSTRFMPEDQSATFRNATETGETNVSGITGLSAYGYVYDNDTRTYYETSTEERGNVTVLSVEETDVRSLIAPGFASTDEMDEDVRKAVTAGIEGERPVVTGEALSQVQQNSLVEHEGSYYQIAFAQASPPITEAFGPLNFAGMGVGVLLLAGGAYMARRVYIEKT
jgi:hypothetical protein